MMVGARAIAILLVAASSLAAQQSTPPTPDSARNGAVATRVLRRIIAVYDAETLDPIAGAQVQELLLSTAMTATSATGHAGIYAPTMVSPTATGTVIAVRKIGYEPIDGLVVDLTDTTILAVRMTRAASLPAVVTTATYNILEDPGAWSGFVTRCTASRAACFNLEDFLKYPVWRLSDHLNLTHGVRINCLTRVPSPVSSSGSTKCEAQMNMVFGGRCTPDYYVDGVLFRHTPPANMTKLEQIEAAFPSAVFKGVEVYPSGYSRPLRFRDDPQCGAIVLWLK